MKRIQASEKKIVQSQPAKGGSAIVVAFTGFVVLFILCLFLSQYSQNRVLATTVQDLRYAYGENYTDLGNTTGQMYSANSFSSIKATDGAAYVRVNFNIMPSDKKRILSIYTGYNQSNLQVNYSDYSDTINITDVLDDFANKRITIEPSSQQTNVDIILKATFAPIIRASVYPAKAAYMTAAADIGVFVIWALALVVDAVCLIRLKKGKLVWKPSLFTWAVGLMIISCLAMAIIPRFGSLIWLKISFAVFFVAEIIFINILFKSCSVPERARQIAISVGILGLAVMFTGSYQMLSLAFIKILGLYFPLALIGAWFGCRAGGQRCIKWREIFFTVVLLLTHIALYGFLLSILPLDISYFLACLPAFLGSVLLFGLQRESAHPVQRSVISEEEAKRLLAYRPVELGKFQDLADVFFQVPLNLQHARNVSLYTHVICKNAGFSEERATMVAQAAFLHDIGKIMVGRNITDKQTALTGTEYEDMKKHTQYGYRLFENEKSQLLHTAAVIAREHHERYDGAGYYGLKGEEIDSYAQMVAIADVFDATTAERPYKRPWSFDECFEYIAQNSGILFAKKYADVFLNSKDEVYQLYMQLQQI